MILLTWTAKLRNNCLYLNHSNISPVKIESTTKYFLNVYNVLNFMLATLLFCYSIYLRKYKIINSNLKLFISKVHNVQLHLYILLQLYIANHAKPRSTFNCTALPTSCHVKGEDMIAAGLHKAAAANTKGIEC